MTNPLPPNAFEPAPLITRGGFRLLPPAAFIRTGPVDHGDWNYLFPLGPINRRRLALATRLLPPHVGRFLKIGYGSGVHLPHWATKADELFGIDPHPHAEAVTEVLRRYGISASLTSGSAEAMPYPDAHFDTVVAISALEFIPDLEAACREVRRVLTPTGRFIVVTPGRSPVVDLGLKLLAGTSAKKDYGDRRAAVVPTLLRHFEVEKQSSFPWLLSKLVCLYTAYRLKPLGERGA